MLYSHDRACTAQTEGCVKMSRLPSHEIPPAHALLAQDEVWAWVIKNPQAPFSAAKITAETGIEKRTVSDYLRRLEKAGILHRDAYMLGVDPTADAPCVRGDGSLIIKRDAKQNMWRAMRKLRDFTLIELVAHAGTPQVAVKTSYAKRYISSLKSAGYLRVIGGGKDGVPSRYRLVTDTGAHAPQTQRSGAIFDPNQREKMAMVSLKGGK